MFAALLVLSAFLLSVAGDYWPWYAVAAVFALVPVIIGPARYRVFGTVGLVLSLFLIFGDIGAGKRLRAQHPEIRSTR